MAETTIKQNRIDHSFQNTEEAVLSVYFTAGFPKLDDTRIILKALQDSGAGMVEIGIPFSDPVADGPTIQMSNQKALANGMTLQKLFEQLKGMREEITIPVILMGYLNPIEQFGIERFCQHCADAGVDGVILPDLPHLLYESDYKAIFEQYGLYNIFLITPQSNEARVRAIDESSHGFVYMVSSASVTGGSAGISDQQTAYFERIQQLKLSNPCLIGFGISDKDSFRKASNYAAGAIIGSAFIRVLEKHENSLQKGIQQYIHSVIQ